MWLAGSLGSDLIVVVVLGADARPCGAFAAFVAVVALGEVAHKDFITCGRWGFVAKNTLTTCHSRKRLQTRTCLARLVGDRARFHGGQHGLQVTSQSCGIIGATLLLVGRTDFVEDLLKLITGATIIGARADDLSHLMDEFIALDAPRRRIVTTA